MGAVGVMHRVGATLLALAFLFATSAKARRHHQADTAGSFDYYLLSLSIAPSFCALSPANRTKAECRDLTDAEYRQMPLTLHGLWPNRAGVSVNRQPQHCPGWPLDHLPASLSDQLQRFMPGGPGLVEHEWSRHGTCSGLSPEAYFGAMVKLAQQANATIGAVMSKQGMLGERVRIADLLTAVAARDPALADAIVVDCRFARGSTGEQALIAEIRVVFSKDFAPLQAASVGLGQNSGCPHGAGFLPG